MNKEKNNLPLLRKEKGLPKYMMEEGKESYVTSGGVEIGGEVNIKIEFDFWMTAQKVKEGENEGYLPREYLLIKRDNFLILDAK